MGWVIITMAMVDVDGSCQFSGDSQPKSTGLVWGLVATPRSVCISGITNFCPPPGKHSLRLTILIHNLGHFGPFTVLGPRHCRGCRWLVMPLVCIHQNIKTNRVNSRNDSGPDDSIINIVLVVVIIIIIIARAGGTGRWRHCSAYAGSTGRTVSAASTAASPPRTTASSRPRSTLSSTSDWEQSWWRSEHEDGLMMVKRQLQAVCVTLWSTWRPPARPRELLPASDIHTVCFSALHSWMCVFMC